MPFCRPESPPPRQPSPELVLTSLPYPPIHSRVRGSSPASRRNPQLTLQLPSSLAGSQHPQGKTLLSSRSYDHLRENRNPMALREPSANSRPRRVSSRLNVSAPATPRSLPSRSPPHSPNPNFKRGHRRSLSFAIPYRSPPPSPTIAAPPPPVPPIPAFALTPTDRKPVLRTHPVDFAQIHLPELDGLSPISEKPTLSPRKQTVPRADGSHGMTCLKFFSLHNSHKFSRTARTCAV